MCLVCLARGDPLRSLSEQSGSLATVFGCDALSIPITFESLGNRAVCLPSWHLIALSSARLNLSIGHFSVPYWPEPFRGTCTPHPMLSERLRINGETNTAGSHTSVFRYKTALASVRAIPCPGENAFSVLGVNLQLDGARVPGAWKFRFQPPVPAHLTWKFNWKKTEYISTGSRRCVPQGR